MLYSSRDPPLEIRDVPGLSKGEDVGYVTFGIFTRTLTLNAFLILAIVLFPRHIHPPDIAESTISHIQLFRDYLHYHIKCSKAYMHSRMRHRVSEFQKVLNRAKTEVATTDRKTIRLLVCFFSSQLFDHDTVEEPLLRDKGGMTVRSCAQD